jgi:hypothetical protein
MIFYREDKFPALTEIFTGMKKGAGGGKIICGKIRNE